MLSTAIFVSVILDSYHGTGLVAEQTATMCVAITSSMDSFGGTNSSWKHDCTSIFPVTDVNHLMCGDDVWFVLKIERSCQYNVWIDR